MVVRTGPTSRQPKSIMPEWIQINSIDASPHDAGTVYVAGTMYKWDDNRPYLYKTSDYGKTWKKITNGIPDTAFTRVIREDPNKRGLLYAGTETGMYVSFDNGERWQSLQLNLPIVPITDLAVQKRDKELVVATQGRSFWILDDLPLLHQMMDAVVSAPREKHDSSNRRKVIACPVVAEGHLDHKQPSAETAGVVVYYFVERETDFEVELEFLDPAGKSIRKFTGRVRRADAHRHWPHLRLKVGRCPPASVPMDAQSLRLGHAICGRSAISRNDWAGEVRGPKMAPGTYQVKLTVDGKPLTQNFEIKADPRVSTTGGLRETSRVWLKIRDKLTETHNAIIQIREVREDKLKIC